MKTTTLTLLTVLLMAGAPGAVAEPYTETYRMEGYLTCGFNFVAAGFMACGVVGSGGAFLQEITLSGTPASVDSVLNWDATTPAGEVLRVLLTKNDESFVNLADNQGPSPLALGYDAAGSGLGAGDGLMVRVFPGDTLELPCVDRPILGGCTTGVGAVVLQPFTLTTTIHYT